MMNSLLVVPRLSRILSRRGLWLILVMLVGTTVGAQGWQRSFGGNKEDQGVLVRETVDHGIISLGFSESFPGVNNSDIDIFIVRTDVDGTELWTKVYDEGFSERPADIVELEDGFLILGTIRPTVTSDDQLYLLNIDRRGNKRWSKVLESATDDAGVAIVPAIDGTGYLITGVTFDKDNGNKDDILLVQVDMEGQELWRKVSGSTENDKVQGLVALNDGYVIASNSPALSTSIIDITNDIVLQKVDASGDSIWSKVYGVGGEIDQVEDLILTADNHLVITGTAEDVKQLLIGKFDTNGDSIWIKKYAFSPDENIGKDIIELQDGSFAAVGYVSRDLGDTDILVIKFDQDGEKEWHSLVGDSGNQDFGESIVAAQDGGFIITGYNGVVFNFINDLILLKLDGSGNVVTNQISGTIQYKPDGCAGPDSTATPLEDWLVIAESADETYFITSDSNGFYSALVDTGTYTIKTLPPNNLWDVCEPEINIVALNEFYDTTEINFDVTGGVDCPAMQVDVTTPFIVNCENAIYSVSYCNLGPITGEGAFLTIALDDDLTYVSSTLAPSAQNDSIIIFQLGDVASMECGEFTITTQIACEGVVEGQATLVRAHIYPDDICEGNDDWSGASIEVRGDCDTETGTLNFRIKNVGDAIMVRERNYFVVEDDLMFLTRPFRLEPQKEEVVQLEMLEGPTYRLIAEQEEGHPGNSYPTVAVEGCVATGGTFNVGMVSQFPEDEGDIFQAVDVQEALSTGSGVLMRGYPKGYQDSIIDQNTEIEYTIIFENTGSEIIDRVVIRDTMSSALDVSSIVLGASSHPYEFEIYNDGILKITFDEIQLQPGGSTEEANSRGFVQFRIAQKPINDVGIVIDNSATVYFDYYAPQPTNTVRHIVGCSDIVSTGCIISDVQPGPGNPSGTTIKVSPNPFFESTSFEITGTVFDVVEFRLFDVAGRLIRTDRFRGNNYDFYRRSLPGGLYMYRMESEGKIIATGKVVIR
ncbi:MAG: T9SS type A sorting domain-containing protein [Saprospiraceae bacterium]|nr:T9SS type A sorting domain-containing protein [Saprospiraceae bacterium]